MALVSSTPQQGKLLVVQDNLRLTGLLVLLLGLLARLQQLEVVWVALEVLPILSLFHRAPPLLQPEASPSPPRAWRRRLPRWEGVLSRSTRSMRLGFPQGRLFELLRVGLLREGVGSASLQIRLEGNRR